MAQPSQPASPSALRKHNLALVLWAIRKAGPASRAAIARETGLSKPTVNEVVEELMRTCHVQEAEPSPRTDPPRPGRRGRPVWFRADQGHLLGLDIGANKVAAIVANLDGKTLASERRRVPSSPCPPASLVLDETRRVAAEAILKAGIDVSSLRAVAVGTPGVVDPESGRVTLAPQIAGWDGIVLKDRLAPLFPCHILVDNEVHLATLGERWRGVAKGIDDAVVVNIGVGIGAGILVSGALYRGARGAAGEIGYLPLLEGVRGEPPDGIGRFEYNAGGAAYARLGRSAAARTNGAILRRMTHEDPTSIDAEVVFRAASEGDRASQRVVQELTERLARGIASLVLVLDPSVVILGGGISRAGDALLGPLRSILADLVPLPPNVVISTLGDEAVALGAVCVAMEWADDELLAPSGLLKGLG